METVHSAEFDSPIGTLRVASTAIGLAYLGLPNAGGRGLAGWLARVAKGARREHAFAPNREAIRQVLEYLEGKRSDFDLPLDLRGTTFQCTVWKALCEIPYGATRSYADVARTVRNPNAVRAVGSANGANPIPLVVPCHRVIASGGKLGGYGGGLDLKRRLLAMEQSVRHQGALL
ncbi:MAG: methylated-DNA--[protein]-cysteine S-methyltransferase [Deltaproteobacteria bacterium]|nr:methylated-DNA--[protein]-cysteine S-methyltransferase [Deltaproteobacteria bacterium]